MSGVSDCVSNNTIDRINRVDRASTEISTNRQVTYVVPVKITLTEIDRDSTETLDTDST